MKVQAIELEGVQLDAAVAKAEGVPAYTDPNSPIGTLFVDAPDSTYGRFVYSPSQFPEQGYPIIERERISVEHVDGAMMGGWVGRMALDRGRYGPTPLIAAMRAFVVFKLGTEIELP